MHRAARQLHAVQAGAMPLQQPTTSRSYMLETDWAKCSNQALLHPDLRHAVCRASSLAQQIPAHLTARHLSSHA